MASLYQAFIEIVPEAKNLRKTLAREFDAAGPDAGRAAGKGINSGVLGSVGKLAGPLTAAFAALGIGSIIKDSIANASDFVEAGTAITAVFGPADATIQKFAANSAVALGQSKNQTLDAARTFGVFGKAAGLGGEDLAGFSTEFITLAADLASFNNTSPEQAIEALGAGLRGESEPLRQYGVLLDDAALKARATELGIYSGTGALTQQQKVLAAQAEIMAQTGTQQGDFAKTSAGLANQQRILSAGLTNLSTTFGAILLPVMTTIVGFLNTSVVPAFQEFASMLAGGEGGSAAAGFVAKLQPVIDFLSSAFGPVFETVGALFAELAPAFMALVPQILEFVSAFSPLSLIFQSIGPFIPQLVGALGALAAMLAGALAGALSQLLPAFTELSGIMVGVIGGLIATLLPVILQLVDIIGPLLTTVIAAVVPIIVLLAGVIGTLLQAVAPLIGAVLELVAPLVQLIASILGPLIKLLAAVITPVIAIAAGILGVLIPVLTFVIKMFVGIIKIIVDVISWFVKLVTGAGTVGDKLSAIFTQLPGVILNALGNLGTLLLDSGKALIQGFIDGIKAMIGNVGKAIGGVMDFVGGFFPNSPADRGQFSGSGWTKLKRSGEAIGDQFGAGLDAATATLSLGSTLTLPAGPRFDASVYGSASVVSGAGGAAFPGTVTLVDVDGSLLGRMRVEVGSFAASESRTLDAGYRTDY